jgi:lipoprotein-releasing system permease protein
MLLNSNVELTVPNGTITPFGPRPATRRFRVCGIFETGMYDIDATWAFTTLAAAQKAASLGDVVNQLELNVDDVNRAAEIGKEVEKIAGPRYTTVTWQERNRPLLNALKTERVVTMIVIGLILMVAALNIFITLAMMVMEKHRDIAVLRSMGAREKQVWAIFTLHGLAIGTLGTLLGLALGYGASWVGDQYHLFHLQADVYSLAYVPFHARPWDGLWIAIAAIAISFIATTYPARAAARLKPVEILRYE